MAITRARLYSICMFRVIYNYNYIEGLISVRTLSRACRATGARRARGRRATGGRRARDRRATGARQAGDGRRRATGGRRARGRRATGARQARAVLAEGGNALLGHHSNPPNLIPRQYFRLYGIYFTKFCPILSALKDIRTRRPGTRQNPVKTQPSGGENATLWFVIAAGRRDTMLVAVQSGHPGIRETSDSPLRGPGV